MQHQTVKHLGQSDGGIRPPPPPGGRGNVEAREGLYLAAVVALYGAFVLFLGMGRSYFGYGTETDFVGAFLPDARRFLAGEPLQSPWHPPLYPILIGALYSLVRNWLTVGVLLSFLSGLVVVITSYLLFLRLGGRTAAWGAVLALMGSDVFVKYSALATSDVFFQALFIGSCLLAVTALNSGSRLLWWACGITVGLGVVTRSNGLTLVLLVLAPLLSRAALRGKIAQCLCMSAGLALPVITILVYGALTGSSVFPQNNHLSLAISYFNDGHDRGSWDAVVRIADRFDSLEDVLLQDPLLIVKTYLTGLYELLAFNVTQLLEPPLYFFVVPGILFLVGMRWSAALALVLAVVAAQLLLVNFKPFEPRFYLFLIPLMGAAVGEMCWRIVRAEWTLSVRTLVASSIVLMFLLASGLAVAKAYITNRGEVAELKDVVPVALQEVEKGSIIVAVKSHLSHYTGAEDIFLPNLESLDKLRVFVEQQMTEGPLYLFYGMIERQRRPQYLALQRAEDAPEWLEAVVWSIPPGKWVLYRYRPTRAGSVGEP